MFNLADENCDIDLTAFKLECDNFFDIVNVDEVYMVSGGAVRNRRTESKTKSEYSIILTADTMIEQCSDESECPPISYNFKKIDQLVGEPVNTLCDVVAIIKSVGTFETVAKRNTEQELVKRDLIIIDDSQREISLTIWEEAATDFAGGEGDVVAGRRLTISDFKGLRLTANVNSRLQLNPNSVRAQKLKAWYASAKENLQTCLIKSKVESFSSSWLNLSMIDLTNVKQSPITFQTKAVICLMGKLSLLSLVSCFIRLLCSINLIGIHKPNTVNCPQEKRYSTKVARSAAKCCATTRTAPTDAKNVER